MDNKKLDEINISQKPAIEVLKNLGYTYIDTQEAEIMRGNLYNVLLKPIIKSKLEELNSYTYKGKEYKFNEKNINTAMNDLDELLTDGLVKTNEKIFNTLLLGRSYNETLEDGTKRSFTIKFIDWEDISNNDFYIVEEFSVESEDGKNTARPDLVLFINGIPFGVIECKKSSLSIDQGISQMIRNQSKDYIPQLFKFIQIVMATNKNETKYATCSTPKKFWSVWKEEDNKWIDNELAKVVKNRIPTNQDKNIISLFHPLRVIEFIKYFILFDKDVKKICRYQQYFAIKEIMKTIEENDENGNRQSGVVWHTQGSGKSLTMVMVAKYILSELATLNPKVIVVTDRVDLDTQINRTFNHTRLKAIKASTGNHLIKLINDDEADIITTLVHKFDTAANKETKLDSRDIFVLVDESHRSQYKELNIKMKNVFPNACYIGFTGTPLMKKQKSTVKKFGSKLIHKYTIADGVEDKAILPLLYEGRMVEQSVNRKAIDLQLDIITRNLNKTQKEEVMKKWSRFERVASSDQRIRLISFDINEHFVNNYKSSNSPFTAMLATSSKSEAIKYLRAFEELNDMNVAVVISPPDMREGHEEVDKVSKDMIIEFWNEMMKKYGNPTSYEDTIKDNFIHGEIDLLIVVDKLLTGFDAPRATVLYIDKEMKEHTLLQAIARVNRLYEGKDYGYIVDYRGLITKLDEAMNQYSGSGLENFEGNDLKGAIRNVSVIIGSLRQYYSELISFFNSVKNKDDEEEYEVYLGDNKLRTDFYELVSNYGRNLLIALESEKIYNELGKEEIEKHKSYFKFYQKLRQSVKRRYSDSIDHKEYEARMQKLIDNYIAAEGMMYITNPVDILDEKAFEEEVKNAKNSRSKADTIRTRLGKSISEKWDENPTYYKKFSERIEKVLEDYKNKRISEVDYLNRMEDLKNKYREKKDETEYPDTIKYNENAQAFYGVLSEVVCESDSEYGEMDDLGKLALQIDNIIREKCKVDWHNNTDVHNQIAQEIDDIIFYYTDKTGIKLTFDDIDKIIEKVKNIALKRY
ncbi:TPA: type I restriction endonuclease subunit R [Clostridioides difficile]|uniref:type I restriction endonuclease subunit R n=2 Tax=Clostridioides difficile TaxID=1496 RepID=UPI0009800FA6|nr:type I restriction endonuclease subunit R [Clostridioides difficile]AXU29202.1 type I restriction-modification system, R subunit [Clostridioides difficile]AXU32990.1 type I restriction-modification system, R subunit [Clostridioides difficile]AXU36778.1 type I restriction-modification system, R subunit [Clostridioides difficile]MCP8413131.1 type I restriction endonuclease subunit R [Clostridioides difficile]MDC9390866.1 type I restriction endonuclease subunit R [Clostridioides difficile]